MNIKKKYLRKSNFTFRLFYILLFLLLLWGICLCNTPKYKVLFAFRKTFLTSNAPLSMAEPLKILQNKSASFHSSITLNRLKLPLVPPALASKISLMEGLSIDGDTNYSFFEQKGNSHLTLSYLYKPYLHANIYADKTLLFLQVPDLLTDYFSMDSTTLGGDFNQSILSDYLHYQLADDFGFSIFPTLFSKEFVWKEVAVTKAPSTSDPFFEDTELASYIVQAPGLVPITVHLDSKHKISGITFTISKEDENATSPNGLCRLKRKTNHIVGEITIQDSNLAPLYQISFEGKYLKKNENNQAAFHFSSVDITDKEETFLLNLYGDVSLSNTKAVEDMPNNNIYDLFRLSTHEVAKLSEKMMASLQLSELQPFLPYLGF